MTRTFQAAVVTTALWLAIFMPAVWAQSDLDKIKVNYQAATSQLQKHLVFDWWIDQSPESPELLARQWTLSGEWVGVWLDAHPSEGCAGVKTALASFMQNAEPDCLKLGEDIFLVAGSDPIGHVFIVARSDRGYRLAWSTADVKQSHGDEAEILAAWRPENARSGGRGPYWAASGSAGSVIPQIGRLPGDGKGRPRFYIDGMYAQSAGATVGGQISVWLWDGVTARPQIARSYTFMADQTVGTRVQGDLLKIQEKKSFRTFYSCGSCEERQTDWTFRLTPDGVQDLGEMSMVPELDAVDELFYRLIHHESATDLAAPGVIQSAESITREARGGTSGEEWKKLPTLGMMGGWKIHDNGGSKILCLNMEDAGSNLFTLTTVGGKLFISDMEPTKQSCEK